MKILVQKISKNDKNFINKNFLSDEYKKKYYLYYY